jgi:uncharacterized protein YndB with AHSA1/START domain
VQQAIELPASPGALYAMYLDAEQHAAFTGGGPAHFSPNAGADWSAFDGRIHGRILALTPGRRIVQTWRSFEWQPDEPDSILVLTLRPAAGSTTRVELTQADVPERLHDRLTAGWPTRYWEPWRAYLEARR